jgi:hypothetical protein
MNGVPNINYDISTLDEIKSDMQARESFIEKKMAMRIWLGVKTMEKFHELGHNLPEECLFGLQDEIPFTLPLVYGALLDYQEFKKVVDSKQIINGYKTYKTLLQLLSYCEMKISSSNDNQKELCRWVLKCPLHIMYLKEIAQVFPDAKIVW